MSAPAERGWDVPTAAAAQAVAVTVEENEMTDEKKNEGGHAFPSSRALERTHTGYFAVEQDRGMSLRDYFAGQALVGLMRFDGLEEYETGELEWRWCPSSFAERAYALADAMLTERGRK